METSIQQDQVFLNALYQRYNYLQDFPCEFRGMLMDEAMSLGMLHSDGFLGAVLAYPVENETLSRNYFPYLPNEVNLKLSKYRHLTPVIPWPQPIIGVAMAGGDQGRVTGIYSTPVRLEKVGNCQLWYGQDVGFIFEAFLEGQVQQEPSFDASMNQLWSICEDFLISQGVSQIYALARDPALDTNWFQGHLQSRGYVPVEKGSVTWVKPIALSDKAEQ